MVKTIVAHLRDYVSLLALPVVIMVTATGLGIASGPWHHEGYAALIFVAGMTFIGATSGRFIAVVCAISGALAFNYFIAEPIHTFNFDEPKDFIPPAVFLVCSAITASIAGRARDQAQAARRARKQLDDLLEVSRRFQSLDGISAVRSLLTAEIERLGEDCALFWLQDAGLVRLAGNSAGGGDAARQVAAADGVLSGSGNLPNDMGYYCQPVADGMNMRGVLLCDHKPAHANPVAADHAVMIEGLARLASLALARVRLAEELAEQRARSRVEQLQSALLMSVSHDLRTPLTTISTAAASLREFADAIAADAREELLQVIEDECARLNRLTENLMQMSRLEAVDLSHTATDIVASDMVRHCLRQAQRTAGQRVLATQLHDESSVVRADTALFELAIGNVLQNAIKYSPDGSTITIASRAEDNACVIAISDQGIGVPPGELAHVFRRFHRGVGPHHGVPGSGLGLAIARGFVEAAGGHITLISPGSDGCSTTVTIRLPLAPGEQAR